MIDRRTETPGERGRRYRVSQWAPVSALRGCVAVFGAVCRRERFADLRDQLGREPALAEGLVDELERPDIVPIGSVEHGGGPSVGADRESIRTLPARPTAGKPRSRDPAARTSGAPRLASLSDSARRSRSL